MIEETAFETAWRLGDDVRPWLRAAIRKRQIEEARSADERTAQSAGASLTPNNSPESSE